MIGSEVPRAARIRRIFLIGPIIVMAAGVGRIHQMITGQNWWGDAPAAAVLRQPNRSMPPSDVSVQELPTRARQLRRIQSVAKGGIIVFFHLNKSGGLSMSGNLREIIPNLQYTFSQGRGTGRSYLPTYNRLIGDRMASWMNKPETFPPHTIHVMEIHSSGNPSFLDLYDQLMAWRKGFSEVHIPFFAFTMVREPISHALSAFNFICAQNKRCWRRGNITSDESGLVKVMHPNLQCRYYLRQWLALAFEETHSHPPLPEECEQVYEKMQTFFDWIGTTERFSDTLHVIEQILPPNSNFKQKFRSINKTHKKAVHQNNLTETSIQYLHDMTSLDKVMHDKIVDDFNSSDIVVY